MNVVINEAGIKLAGDKCWICGGKKEITNHHCIPQVMKPAMNVQIPVCRDCHDKIHLQDDTQLVHFAHKIQKTIEEVTKKTGVLIGMIGKKEQMMTIGDVTKDFIISPEDFIVSPRPTTSEPEDN